MKLPLIAAVLFLPFITSEKKIVCYWQSIISADDINPTLCTHIIYAFVGVDDAGDVFYLSAEAPQNVAAMVKLKEKNVDLSVMVAVGGANEVFSKAFATFIKSPVSRVIFVANVVQFLQNNSLSGVDIDYEFPATPEDKSNFIMLLEDLKKFLDPLNYTLSVAVAPDKWRAEAFYEVAKISALVDFINLMTYDFFGPWSEQVGHHSQLYPHHRDSLYMRELNCAASVNFWLAQKALASKLILGIPTYGNLFVLQDETDHKIGSDVNVKRTKEARGNLGFNEYCAAKSQWKQHFDTDFRVFYAVNELSWFGFDGVQKVIEKVKFAKSRGLGGVMFWSIDTDDHRNSCKLGKFPLISAAGNEINRN